MSLAIDRRAFLELEKLAIGSYAPLTGFMTEAEVASVVERMRLPDSRPFPLPVVLPIAGPDAVGQGSGADLTFDGSIVGAIDVASTFRLDLASTARGIFGTDDPSHPGVRAWLAQSGWFAGGPVELAVRASPDEPTPAEMRALFASKGWQTIVAFNTRNIPHRAHEYLQRLALELADGLLIHPIVGPRKRGDYTLEAVLRGYRAFIDQFLPADRVVLAPLAIPMRYAGPRDAVFHALIRRNYGCSHIVIGRDHAGVGEWYGRYEAQELACAFGAELGIGIVRGAGPFYCEICGGIVSERTCQHQASAPAAVASVSGSAIRDALTCGVDPHPELIRPEVVASLQGVRVFIEADE
jgi:sulfate adenylyltransferase